MTKLSAFRIPEETVAKLDELARAYGTTKTAFLILKIEQEYDALQGNPRMKKMLSAMQECAQILKEATEEAKGLADGLEPVQLAIDALNATDEE